MCGGKSPSKKIRADTCDTWRPQRRRVRVRVLRSSLRVLSQLLSSSFKKE